MRHHDPADLHAAMLRVGLDPARTVDAMRAGIGAVSVTGASWIPRRCRLRSRPSHPTPERAGPLHAEHDLHVNVVSPEEAEHEPS